MEESDRLALMEDLAVLTQARALVAKGWCQGRLVDDEGSVCAVGAIYEVLVNRGLAGEFSAMDGWPPLRWYAQKALEDVLDWESYRSIFEFNDDQLTTQADVLALYDMAITKLKNQEVI